MDKLASLLREFERIEINSSVCKFAHFGSSNSKESLTISLGIPVVIINVMIGSTFIRSLGHYSETVISLLSLLAAILAGVQTYLSFQKRSMLHIGVGNMYSDVEREARIAKGKCQAGILNVEEGWALVSDLEARYSEANRKAQDCPLTDSSLEKARIKLKKIRE